MGKFQNATYARLTLVLVILIALGSLYFAGQEPVYEGRTLDELLSCFSYGTRGFPISVRDEELTQWLRRQQEAGEILQRHSNDVIPRLKNRLNEKSWSSLREGFYNLQLAYSKINGGEVVHQDVLRWRVVEAVQSLGSDAASLAPDLINLARSPSFGSTRIAWALGQIHGDPEIVVPFLIESLALRNNNANAVEALGEYGTNSLAAVPKIIEVIHGGQGNVRRAGASGLLKIDPDAAITVLPLLRESAADESEHESVRKRLQRVIEDIENYQFNTTETSGSHSSPSQ